MQVGIHARDFLISRVCDEPKPSQEVMKSFIKVAKVWDVFKLTIPFLAFLLIGGVIRWYISSSFWDKAADALIIAGLIGAAIELWSTSVLIEHVAKELSERLVGYGLPHLAQTTISRLVHDSDVVLRDYRATFSMVRHPSKDGYVIVRLTLDWKALNNGTQSIDYRTGLSDELIYNPQLQSLQRADSTYGPNDLPSEQIENTQRAWKAPKFILKPSNASVGADSLNLDQYCTVRWVLTLDMPERYSAVVSFGAIVIEPEIRFDRASDGPCLNFHANPDPTCTHVESSLVWKYHRAFIPEQCIRVWWEPLEDPASARPS